MAIEDLKTKEDLARFIEETVQGLPMNTVKGLANALALTLRADVQQVEVTIPEGAKLSAPIKVSHELGTVPRHVSFEMVDEEPGENTYGYRIVSRTDKDFTFVVNAAVAAGGGGISKVIEWMAFRGGDLL
jgi:hypothetical protein